MTHAEPDAQAEPQAQRDTGDKTAPPGAAQGEPLSSQPDHIGRTIPQTSDNGTANPSMMARALRESEQRRRGLINSIDLGFCSIEMLYNAAGEAVDYRFIEVNPTFVRYTGFTDAVGKTIRELAPNMQTDWVRAFAQVVENGEPLRFEQRTTDGKWFEVDAVRVGGAESHELILLFTDITGRRQAAAERLELLGQVQAALQANEAALARAEQATRERDLLISIAAHDLRTPLTVILSQALLLQRRAASAGIDEPARRTLITIAAQAERLKQMIEALLDLSRIQEGRLIIQPAPYDLVALLRRVVDEVQSTVETHRFFLRAPATPIIINAELFRLEQVFFNLLGNAVKYSPEGGMIDVLVEPTARTVRVHVRDEGIGIPATSLPDLFTRFYRAPNAGTHSTSSLGVGLYVVRELVQAHGGNIAVESTEGAGSTFTVELPLLDPAPDEAMAS